MSKRFNFTIAAINNIELPEKGRVEYRDTKVPELTLRVTATGSKSFSVAKRIGSKNVRVTLGKFPVNTIEQARKKARENLLQLENGVNPTEKKRIERIKLLSVTDIYEQYEDNFKARIKVGERRQKSLEDFSRTWKLHVKPRIGKHKAKEVSHAIALKVTDDIKANKTAALFNASIALLRAMFKFAVSHELVKSNPFSSISKVRIESKTRFLSREEIAKLFDSLKEEKQIYQDVVQILIYTGQRKGNVYSMEWSELDLARGVWTIPHAKTKTKTVYHAQLATPAVEILKRRQKDHEDMFDDSPFVFATRQRGNQKGHLSTKSDISGYWKRIIDRAGLHSDEAASRITPHTMRKTLASWQVLEGVDLLSISKSLGHSDISTTAKSYAHLSGDTVKAGVQKATDAMQSAMGTLFDDNVELKLIEKIKSLPLKEQIELLEQLSHE